MIIEAFPDKLLGVVIFHNHDHLVVDVFLWDNWYRNFLTDFTEHVPSITIYPEVCIVLMSSYMYVWM